MAGTRTNGTVNWGQILDVATLTSDCSNPRLQVNEPSVPPAPTQFSSVMWVAPTF